MNAEQKEQQQTHFVARVMRSLRRALECDSPNIREWLVLFATDATSAGQHGVCGQLKEIIAADKAARKPC